MKNYRPLVIFGCVHIGHRNADLKMAQRYVNFVKETDANALLLSDNFENVIPKKGHMMFDQVLTPQEQLDYGEELFYPIRKKILGLVQGNHSGRTRHEAGIDMDYELAKHLGLKKLYNPNQGFVVVKAGKVNYGVAYKHGTGFGSNTFGNSVTLMRQFPSADVCACSHTHELATTNRGFWDINKQGKRVRHDVTLVNTGSLLNFPSYADEAYYAPQRKGFAILYLNTREKEVIVDVSGKI